MYAFAWGWGQRLPPALFLPPSQLIIILLLSLCECCSASPNSTLTLDLMLCFENYKLIPHCLFSNPNPTKGGKVETSDRATILLALIRRKKRKGEPLTPMQLSAAREAIGDKNSPEDALVDALERVTEARNPPIVVQTSSSPRYNVDNSHIVVTQSGEGSERTDKGPVQKIGKNKSKRGKENSSLVSV